MSETSEFNSSVRAARKLWSGTTTAEMATPETLIERLRPLIRLPDMNFMHVDMRAADPAQFRMNVLVENLKLVEDGAALGDFGDQAYMRRCVLPHYQEARETQRPLIATITTDIDTDQGRYFTIYDRMILPQKTGARAGQASWALSFSRTRVVLPAKSDSPSLTQRDHDVLRCLVLGLSARETGETLALSPRTVEHRIESLKRKFGARNSVHLAALAVSHAIS